MRLRRPHLHAIAIWAVLLFLPAVYGLSYVRSVAVIWLGGGGPSISVVSARGKVSLVVIPAAATVESPPSFNVLVDHPAENAPFALFPGTAEIEQSFGGLALYYSPFDQADPLGSAWMVQVPYWLLCIPIAIVIFRRLRRARTRSIRRRRGLCLSCGYDLRATTVRCPECGTQM